MKRDPADDAYMLALLCLLMPFIVTFVLRVLRIWR